MAGWLDRRRMGAPVNLLRAWGTLLQKSLYACLLSICTAVGI